ncbi:MAG: 23S rRNA (pseudouridine(1915)-N(3))-methyltransferase RlmH [Terracidiphilus sp.]
MNLTLAHIGARPSAKDDFEALTALYLGRCSTFAHCRSEAFRSEKALLEWLDKQQGRTPGVAVLLDSSGRQMSSDVFAAWLGARRDQGTQHIVFAVGPASGWSEPARKRAQLLLSLGPMTMAHALARLVVAEQLYRAITILTGHPYHAGH